jgi:SpoIID/LytB domain protein
MRRLRLSFFPKLAAIVLSSAFVVAFAPSAPVSAFTNNSVIINGHGFGHGRGMGQYGALGYALNSNWSYTQIIDHYYSNTSGGGVANDVIGVNLISDSPSSLIVHSDSDFNITGGHNFSAHSYAMINRNSSNLFNVYTGPGCGGPWSLAFTQNGDGASNVTVSPVNPPGDDRDKMIQRCTTSGARYYRGTLIAHDNGSQHVVNNVATEDYLKGVVPRESPASWGDLGGGKGMEALKAQAVAARSYARSGCSAQNCGDYSSTCDTTACQVYGGFRLNSTDLEDARTNTAVSDTSGQARVLNGAIAHTEFSSSTGGYTAGGTFPAVPDDGDSVSQNPNHNWQVSISISAIQNAYPSVGSLQSIAINSRNGLGEDGGRVTSMTIFGSSGSTTTTGDSFRSALGLKSNWFKIGNQASGGLGGYWIAASDGGIFTFGNAQYYGSKGGQPLNQPIVNMAAAPNSDGYWLVARDGGIFTFGGVNYYGSKGGQPLNQPVIAMAATLNGGGYWEVATDGGIFAFGNANFYGSKGGQPLNRPIVGMARTVSGNGYWLVASDGGIFAFGDAQYYGSTGGQKLNQPIVGMAPTPSGDGYWLVAADGGIFTFGGAQYYGSGASSRASFVGMEATRTGSGYMLLTNNGNVYSYGDAPDFQGVPNIVHGYNGRVLAIRGTAS